MINAYYMTDNRCPRTGVILVASVWIQISTAIGPDDCCFTFYPRPLPRTAIISYNMTDTRCPRTGVIFVSQKSRRICVDPNLQWVQKIMASLDGKTSSVQNHKTWYGSDTKVIQGQYCQYRYF
ncbi:hypothetical protein INR49_005930 [Caranx melampygus]|nr:hypothetical protein INR49_005930 [Caranx melampygus]